LKVALISFEYPPSVAIGGIGTYSWHASRMLAEHGINVEVFAAGPADSVEQPHSHIRVQRVVADSRAAFASLLVAPVVERHQQSPFDLIEAPEIGPEGAQAFEALPLVARVLKLHTPSYLVGKAAAEKSYLMIRLRYWLGALRQGRWATLKLPSHYRREDDAEYHGALLADEIAAPGRSIAHKVTAGWSLDPEKVHIYPLPFQASRALLDLPVPTTLRTLGFVGRLEPRKGIVELVQAIPKILQKEPSLRFRFIGPSWPYHGTDMQTWIQLQYPHILHALEFTGAVPPEQVPAELARCDVLILPSRWESFGFTCCEALASGRAVIGSSAGGMAEMIEPGISGLLVPPYSPAAIADAVLSLAASPEKVFAYGSAGRERIVRTLAPERILPLQLAGYERAIRQAARRNASRSARAPETP